MSKRNEARMKGDSFSVFHVFLTASEGVRILSEFQLMPDGDYSAVRFMSGEDTVLLPNVLESAELAVLKISLGHVMDGVTPSIK